MNSRITIDQVYREVRKIQAEMVKREDLDVLVDTIEILSKPTTIRKIKTSDRDITEGRVKAISSVEDLIRECA